MELYRKVYIKSEADFPKEDGVYYVACFGSNKDLAWYSFNKSHKENQNFWNRAVDWYLILEPEITDADIEAWAETMYSKTFGSKYIQLLTKGAKAMRDGEIKHIDK
jgi:hypothetical protein